MPPSSPLPFRFPSGWSSARGSAITHLTSTTPSVPPAMVPGEIRGPDLAGVVANANKAGLEHVVIGGFAVIGQGSLGSGARF